jgi:putative spermidine/putrescine transport system ATP-binding protein
MIAGLVQTTSGRIVVDGHDITLAPTWARDMGLVFQSYALFPHMTVAGNVAFGLEMRNMRKAEIATRVAAAIAMVRLTGRETAKPAQLSGGQQQRVALARALVIRPSILLLDEPLSNLDAKLRDEMRTEIRDIQKRLGITMIFVTHDQDEALTMSDRVVVMNKGRIEQVGSPEDLYERPATPFVAGFVGRTNRMTGSVKDGVALVSGLTFAVNAGDRARAEIMIRPQRISIAPTAATAHPGLNSVAGHVIRSVYAGSQVQYTVDVSGTVFEVEQSTTGGDAVFPQGMAVTLNWAVADTLVFGGAT